MVNPKISCHELSQTEEEEIPPTYEEAITTPDHVVIDIDSRNENGGDYQFPPAGDSSNTNYPITSYKMHPAQMFCRHCQKVVSTKVRRKFDGNWTGLCCWTFMTVIGGIIIIPCLCVWLLARLSCSHYQHSCPECGKKLALYERWNDPDS